MHGILRDFLSWHVVAMRRSNCMLLEEPLHSVSATKRSTFRKKRGKGEREWGGRVRATVRDVVAHIFSKA